MNPKYRFATRLSKMRVSAVREILKVTERPDIISFAGGLPAPELFPVEAMAKGHADVFREAGQAAMQYSTTEGWRPLREWIAGRLNHRGIRAEADRVLVTTGSQQAIDLVARIFLDPGDAVIVENPTYLAALQSFTGFEASLVAVGSDEDGMITDEVEAALAHAKPKLIYLVADFHNPKGTTLSAARREHLVKLSQKYGVPILEDDPYSEIRFDGEPLRPLASIDDDGLVIYTSTFSKTLSPGLRIGWISASREVFSALVTAKQPADLHTSTIAQRATAKMLSSFDYDRHIAGLRKVYEERCRTMLDALEKHFPSTTRWTKPGGGLFIWVELPGGLSAESLLREAIEHKVAFVPGDSFFAANPPRNFMRLNFSNSSPEIIREGISRLGSLVKRRTE
jgi:2-aminoadipate transaminase